jgi:hypothetical protein
MHGSNLIGAVALIFAGLAAWAPRMPHAAPPVAAAAQIDPLPMMAMTRDPPLLAWTDYSLVFAK